MFKRYALMIKTMAWSGFLTLVFIPQAFALTTINQEKGDISVRVLRPEANGDCVLKTKKPSTLAQYIYDVKKLPVNSGFSTDQLPDQPEEYICLTYGIYSAPKQYWLTLKAKNYSECTITIKNIDKAEYTVSSGGYCSITKF